MTAEEIVERSLPFVQPHYRENIKIQIQAAINRAVADAQGKIEELKLQLDMETSAHNEACEEFRKLQERMRIAVQAAYEDAARIAESPTRSDRTAGGIARRRVAQAILARAKEEANG